ncbi:hypothetical protein ES703_19344 [subsurface metagenome]
MTVIFYQSLEAPASTPNTAWTERASKQGTLNARKHWVWVYAEYGGTETDRVVAVRVLINGAEVAGDYHKPELANQYKAFSTMIEVEPPVDGSLYTVSLEYRAVVAPQVALGI